MKCTKFLYSTFIRMYSFAFYQLSTTLVRPFIGFFSFFHINIFLICATPIRSLLAIMCIIFKELSILPKKKILNFRQWFSHSQFWYVHSISCFLSQTFICNFCSVCENYFFLFFAHPFYSKKFPLFMQNHEVILRAFILYRKKNNQVIEKRNAFG